MKRQSQEMIVKTHYSQAVTLIRRKQFDQALPFVENTIALSEEYGVEEEKAQKSKGWLPSLYNREGNKLYKQEKFDEAATTFDKVI